MMNKTAMITGASRGIGAAIAKTFAREGYHLSLCCQNSYNELLQLSNTLKEQYHIEVLCFQGDVANEAFIKSMVTQTLEQFSKIDVLINNAGISHVGLLSDMSGEDWNRVISTNLSSVFYTSHEIIPSMVQRKEGRIINISSVWGEAGASCEVAYSASKGGVNTFTKALAKELAPSNISVNAISCGVIDTQMNACFSDEEKHELIEEIPANRMGSTDEVAQLVLLTAKSPAYMTGQILRIDGGWI